MPLTVGCTTSTTLEAIDSRNPGIHCHVLLSHRFRRCRDRPLGRFRHICLVNVPIASLALSRIANHANVVGIPYNSKEASLQLNCIVLPVEVLLSLLAFVVIDR